MCGRFTQTKSRDEVLEELGGLELPPLFTGRFNIAPTQKVAVIRQNQPAQAEESLWGIQNPRTGAPIINARCETLAERPMFRDLLASSRCLIPADGFYEWNGKQPYYFQLENQPMFAFAGLLHNKCCVIITQAADANMQGIHHRMPVICTINNFSTWLNESRMPEKPASLEMRPVSRRVNSVAHDDPACLAPLEVHTDLSLFPDDD